MASYKVAPEAKEEYEYIAYLLHQLRYYTEQVKLYDTKEDNEELEAYKKLADFWLKHSVTKVTSSS